MPDFQGLFLRGLGSQVFNSGGFGDVAHVSGSLGAIQGDAGRNVKWNTDDIGGSGIFGNGRTGSANGLTMSQNTNRNTTVGCCAGYGGMSYDSSKTMPTANEFRPANTAVRYLVKAMM